MNILESYRLTLRNLLGAALREHSGLRQWHYAIDAKKENPDSLASYLGIGDEDLRTLFVSIGLASYRGKQCRLNRTSGNKNIYSWEQFRITQNLQGYMDYMVVKGKRYLWIRLGSKEPSSSTASRSSSGPYNPSTQGGFFKASPRLPGSSHFVLKKSRSMMMSIVAMYANQHKVLQEEGKERMEEMGSRPPTSSTTMQEALDLRVDDEESTANLQTLAKTLLETIENNDTVSSSIKAIERLMSSIRVSQDEEQKARLRQLIEGNEECVVDDEVLEIASSSYPLLTSLLVPVSKRLISTLLREIVGLSSSFTGHGLLSFETHRGTASELVNIRRSKTKESFVRGVCQKDSWLRSLPNLVVGENVEPSVGASWILERLALDYEDEFVHVCKEMGYPMFSKKMDAATACAMWQESNVSRKSSRTILRYLAAEFGTRLVVPEAEVDSFGQNHIPPVSSSYLTSEGKKIHFWTKPIGKVLEASVATFVNEKTLSDDDILATVKGIDIVFGGDHGQGKFRSVIKIIVRGVEKKVTSMVMKVGHIDCKKDTYEVIKRSIALPLNDSLAKVIESGRLQIFRKGDGTIGCNIHDDIPIPTDPISSVPIRVFVTGDLAYLAAILGKVSMSGGWCTWCRLSPAQWGEIGHEKGDVWTLENMLTTRDDITAGRIENTPANRKGCVADPLLTCVYVRRYIIPLLHTQIGVGNRLIDSYYMWVELRVEVIPDEEIEARVEVYEAHTEWEIQKELWDQWVNTRGTELADLREERLMVNFMAQQRGEDGIFVNSSADRKAMAGASKAIGGEMVVFTDEKKAIKAELDTYSKLLKVKSDKLKTLKKKRKSSLNEVRNRLEQHLVEMGIERAAYHGGDLNGKNIEQFFREADGIFNKFQEILLEVPIEDGRCEDGEIIDMIRRYKELCTLLDYLFSLARTPTGETTDEILETANKCAQAVGTKWRDLRLSTKGPKFHLLEDHLAEQMEIWHGIGDFFEDFIEQAHQFGMKDEQRTLNMRDRVKAANSHSKWEWAESMSEQVRIAKKEMKKTATRKRKVPDGLSLAERNRVEKKQRRQEKRRACLAQVSLEPDPIEDTLTRARMEQFDYATR
jgi:hypothetical protein